MITNIILAISTWITHVISDLGYVGVALLMAIESAAIPLPSEIIMPFSGYLVSTGRFTLWGLSLAGAIGSTLGSFVTYYLGYHGGRRLIAKYEHLVHVSEGELGLTERFFSKLGPKSTLLGRVVPVVRTFISIPAGIAKVPVVPFLIYAFVGSFIWSYFLAWLGLKLGENWHGLESYFRKFDYLVIAVVLGLIMYWLYRHFGKKSEG